ncbi:cobaltochelatase CobT-related protein [[Clostridium] symbiosum]|uniref:cobaltochelatase CobT-related protein n=1 Tax=Clostridium symbiosum TaxID=1512 RepID=UPI0034A23E2F
MGEKGYDRSRIRDIKKKITNRQIFTSKPFTKNMEKIANSLVWKAGRKIKVTMGWDTGPSAKIAFTGGKLVYINAANEITRSFPTKELKTESLVGFLGHECGHQRYTAMGLRNVYGNGFREGRIYPRPPVPENEKESNALAEMKEFLQAGDKAAVSVITDTALRIQNILEDVYIEIRMCDEYPGSVRNGILMNANRQIEKLPTVTQEIQQQDHGLAIILNLILGYARAGEINNWEGYIGEYLDCLNDCMEVIDDSVVDVDETERFRASNQLLLKIWDYMKDLIDFLHEKEQESADDTGSEKTDNQGNLEDESGETLEKADSQDSGQEEAEDIFNQIFSRVAASVPDADEDENDDIPEEWDGKWDDDEEENSEAEIDDGEQQEGDGSGEEQEPLESAEGTTGEETDIQEDAQEENLLNALLQLFRESSRPMVTNQEGGRFKGESACEAAEGEESIWKDNDYDGNGYLDAAEDMNRILYDMAEEKYEKEQEKAVVKALEDQAETMDFGKVHAGCAIEVHRMGTVPVQCRKMYDSLSPDILKLAKRLWEEMYEILYSEEEYMEKNLQLGKKVDSSRLYRQDKRIFMRRKISEEGKQAAIAVLIDESISMGYGDRITYGRLAALIIYDVCVNLGIPVIVYGHSTSMDWTTMEETVDLYAYAEFDSIDGQDRYRIMDMSPRGSNRDGAAIRFVAERLKTRQEELKLFFLASDGQPSGLNYSGDLAKEDLKSLKKELKQDGILLFAAAIGEDRKVIEEIYEDGFLNISELSMLPVRIVQKIVSYLR